MELESTEYMLWNTAINSHLCIKLTNWSYSFNKYGDLHDIMIQNDSKPYFSTLYSLFCVSYLSKIYLFNVSSICMNELYTYYLKNNGISLQEIITILINNRYRPMVNPTVDEYMQGLTRPEFKDGACTWYIYAYKN